MNPAALKVNLPDLEDGGTLIVNTDGFTPENLKYANYATNPLDDNSLAGYRVHKLPISTLNMNALKERRALAQEIDRSKNFFALGVLYWLYDRPMENTLNWIRVKFAKSPELAKANEIALKTGYNFADTTEVFDALHSQKAKIAPGKYRKITGNEATAIGFITASQLSGRPCSTVHTQSRLRQTFCTSCRVTKLSAFEHFRPKTRLRSLRRDRSKLRRTDRTYRNVRAWRGAETGSDRTCCDG